MKLVVDASVALKWYLPEPHTDAALRLLDDEVELVVPDLFFAEMGNALWKRWRRQDIDARTVADVLTALRVLPLAVRESRVLLDHAADLGMANGIAVYDALYLAAAAAEDARLVTADRRLHAAVTGPLARRIAWIEDPL